MTFLPSLTLILITPRGYPSGCLGRKGSLSPKMHFTMRQPHLPLNLGNPFPPSSFRLAMLHTSSQQAGVVSRSP